MAVQGVREILPRELTKSYGQGAGGVRTFVVTCDENTTTEQIVNYIGITEGQAHPEVRGLFSSGFSISRNGDDGVQAIFTYDTADKADTNPLQKPAEWSFSSGMYTVPSLSYYYGAGNNDIRPLTNVIGEYVWEGLTHNEAEVKATIAKNKLLLNAASEFNLVGCLNASQYLWGKRYTWQCTSVTATRAQDKVGDVVQVYWRLTYELSFRATGWYYNLPHVGWVYKDGSTYKRCQINSANGLQDSPKPMPLNENGGLKFAVGSSGVPDQLLRRVHRDIDFSVFGFPPP